jgi:porphobilinogen deaminase
MIFDRPIVLGARASVLAQVQARLVGETLLARHPGLKIEYSFLASPCRRELDTPLQELLRKGGFTGKLKRGAARQCHRYRRALWKDLPFAGIR